jgi:two-component system chemotaxis response regulator CheB
MKPPERAKGVLIVAEAEALCRALRAALDGDAFAIVAAVRTASAATRACLDQAPDVAVIDAGLGAGEGLRAVQEVMAYCPTPILVLTAAPEGQAAFEAMNLGALDAMGYPGPSAPSAAFGEELRQRLKLLCGVRVITHLRGRRSRPRGAREGCLAVGVAASLGGPRALSTLFKGLPRDLPASVLVVQHISDGFSRGLASWLASESGLKVKEAEHGEALVPGVVLVAPSRHHLLVGDEGRVVLDDGPPVEGFRPSATALLRSLARHFGPRAVGVVLTGMGHDGAQGLAAMRAAGGRTLAQDEASCTVYGMPRAAVEAGAAERVVGLSHMARAVTELVRQAGALKEGA